MTHGIFKIMSNLEWVKCIPVWILSLEHLNPLLEYRNHVFNSNTRSSSGYWFRIVSFHLDDKSCVLCEDNTNETMQHLFFGSDFSQTFWWKLNQEWNYDLELMDMLLDGRARSDQPCFIEYLIIGCWSLWNHRNRIIFDHDELDWDACFSIFVENFSLIIHRAKPSLREGMQQWLDAM